MSGARVAITAGAAAVIVGGAVIAADWGQIAPLVTGAATVIVWTVSAALIIVVTLGTIHVSLWVWHTHHDRLASRAAIPPAVVIPPAAMPAIEAPAILPAIDGGQHIHLHIPDGITPDAATALLHHLNGSRQ
jgi:hypothetical protein